MGVNSYYLVLSFGLNSNSLSSICVIDSFSITPVRDSTLLYFFEATIISMRVAIYLSLRFKKS